MHFLTFELVAIRDFHPGIIARHGLLASYFVRGFGGAVINIPGAAERHVGGELADVHFGIRHPGVQADENGVGQLASALEHPGWNQTLAVTGEEVRVAGATAATEASQRFGRWSIGARSYRAQSNDDRDEL